jgi:tetratricopeptide (TPR) repeat protein
MLDAAVHTHRLRRLAALWGAAFAAACAREPAPIPSALDAAASAYAAAPENEKVLAANHIALDLMHQGHVAEARDYLLDASAIIEAVFSEDRYAEQAASLWRGESRKIFRGEPHERATTYYHLGICFMMLGDYQNARACFRSAAFQDSFAAEDQDKSDFYLMHYLETVADAQARGNGGDGAQLAGRIGDRRDALVAPDPRHDLLLICETGSHPIKLPEGQYGELLAFSDAGDPVWAIEATFDGERYYVYDGANLFYQAVTRGGRFVDHINRRKATYKKSAYVSANVAWVVAIACFEAAALEYEEESRRQAAADRRGGAHQSSNVDGAQALLVVGAVAALVGVTFHVIGELITPNADLRTLQTAPNRIYVRSLRAPSGARELTLRYYGQHLNEVKSARTISLPPQRDGLTVLYVTERGEIAPWTLKDSR